MKSIIKINPEGKTISADPGKSIKENLEMENIYFQFNCGGKGICLNCRIEFQSKPPAAKKNEKLIFGKNSTERLSCMHKPAAECTISLPENTVNGSSKIITSLMLGGGGKGYGFGIDLGTTTAAVYLVSFESGRVIHQSSFLNPQTDFGSDVITRLELARDNMKRANLTSMIQKVVKNNISEALSLNKIKAAEVSMLRIAGNSVMTHLFLGEDAAGLEKVPFISSLQDRDELPFDPKIIDLHKFCSTALVPLLYGFIGGDTTAAILASDLDKAGKTRILIDLGTNGEIVLVKGKNIWASSAAAGPAFDGMGMFSGMPAIKGAIEAVTPKGDVNVIGFDRPKGICGSGYLSAIAYLLDKEILNYSGLLQADENGRRAWTPVPGNTDIQITQDDIRKFQLAKGAIAAGIEILCKESGTKYSEIDGLIVTGSFGSRIDAQAALDTGMFPDIPKEKIAFIDNAAGRGAVLALNHQESFQRIKNIRCRIKFFNLGEHADFQDIFAMNMLFPYKAELF